VFATGEGWLRPRVSTGTVERVHTNFLSQSAEGHASCKSRAASSATNSVEDPVTGNETFCSLYRLKLIQALSGNH
jgi:predicted PhzF superfamily epimerase YddE/YHI9